MERKSKAIFGFDLNDPPLIVEKKTREKKRETKKRSYRTDCTLSKRNKLIPDSIHFFNYLYCISYVTVLTVRYSKQ